MIILRYKEFARKDYEGHSSLYNKILKQKRSEYAAEIRRLRNEDKKAAEEAVGSKKPIKERSTKVKYSGGGATSKIDISTVRNKGVRSSQVNKEHAAKLNDALLNNLKSAKSEIANSAKTQVKKRVTKGALGAAAGIGLAALSTKKYLKNKKDAEELDTYKQALDLQKK